jgi:hypothetical protein
METPTSKFACFHEIFAVLHKNTELRLVESLRKFLYLVFYFTLRNCPIFLVILFT